MGVLRTSTNETSSIPEETNIYVQSEPFGTPRLRRKNGQPQKPSNAGDLGFHATCVWELEVYTGSCSGNKASRLSARRLIPSAPYLRSELLRAANSFKGKGAVNTPWPCAVRCLFVLLFWFALCQLTRATFLQALWTTQGRE